jgi:hypothetical protein
MPADESGPLPAELVTERYAAQGATDIALRLHREGLIFRINREVLHPLGLALGIAAEVDRSSGEPVAQAVYALTLQDTGGEPMEFSAAAVERNEAKLREHGHDLG